MTEDFIMIDDAAKDGSTRLLLNEESGLVMVGHWNGDFWQIGHAEDDHKVEVDEEPTHYKIIRDA